MSFTSSEGGWETSRDIRQYPACPQTPIYTEVKDRAFSVKSAFPVIGKVHGSKEDNLCVLKLWMSPFQSLFPRLRFPSPWKSLATLRSIPGQGSYFLVIEAHCAQEVALTNVHCAIYLPSSTYQLCSHVHPHCILYLKVIVNWVINA